MKEILFNREARADVTVFGKSELKNEVFEDSKNCAPQTGAKDELSFEEMKSPQIGFPEIRASRLKYRPSFGIY